MTARVGPEWMPTRAFFVPTLRAATWLPLPFECLPIAPSTFASLTTSAKEEEEQARAVTPCPCPLEEPVCRPCLVLTDLHQARLADLGATVNVFAGQGQPWPRTTSIRTTRSPPLKSRYNAIPFYVDVLFSTSYVVFHASLVHMYGLGMLEETECNSVLRSD